MTLPKVINNCLGEKGYVIVLRREPPLMLICDKFDPKEGLKSLCAVTYDSAKKEVSFSNEGIHPYIVGYIQGRVAEMMTNDKDFYTTFELLVKASGRF